MTGRRRWRAIRSLVALLCLAVLAAACADGTGSEATEPAGDSPTETGETGAESGGGSGDDGTDAEAATTDSEDQPVVARTGDLPVVEGSRALQADLDGPTTSLVTLQEDPYIGAALYPRPEYEANPWSQWGQGVALEDGRVIMAMGDHLGVDGNSYLFVYDPDAGTVTRFADVISALPHEPGSWGYGKIHSQMVDAGDGGIWFTTYYGTRRDLSFGGSYEGDVLFRLDQETLELQAVDVPAPGHGVPSLATDGRGRLYGEAVDPLAEDYPAGGSFVYDVAAGEVSLFEEDPGRDVFRSVMVAEDGTAWFAGEDGALFRYDPSSGEISEADERVGSGGLRAVTPPLADGTIYGVTGEPFGFFAFRPGEGMESLGRAVAYTTSLALLPDESGFLYVPGAHGSSPTFGSPLIRVDGATGEQTVVAELFDLVEEEFGLVAGGTYSVTVDPERGRAHIGFNAGTTADEPWGELVLAVVELQ